MQRRDALKSMGGILGTAIIGGAGVTALTDVASAATTNLTSGPVTVSNDRGEVTQVTLDPSFTIEWSNFDDAVGKIFVLIEAEIDGEGYSPIYRATPWLTDDEAGTSGSFTWPTGTSPVEALNLLGRPDYENADYSAYGSVDAASYLDGTSMGSASDADANLDGQDTDGDNLSDVDLVNNFPSGNAGYYGAADDASKLDNENDGSDKVTTVNLRYTFEFQAPNQSYVDYVIDNNDDTDGLDDGRLSGVREDDILEDSQGNSKIVMNGEDDNYTFANPSGIPYSELIANSDAHVGVISTVSSFDVTVTNEGSTNSITGSSGTGGT